MRDPIVLVENLTFNYRIRHAGARSLKQAFINTVKGIKSDIYVEAITEINFKLSQGEVLGIVGNNGAGKSTLLKLLSGILPPTSGAIKVRGRIAPLIELGAGFNPELTGAENIVLFGVLLGNTKAKMEENLTAIANWAGLTEAIHLPIRTYSTGMLSRLGFAVATFQQCDLLIIDEVLSVGDADFQVKSMSRMEELISKGEATILVSHDLNLVAERATKVLWLDHGKQMMFGDPKEVIDAYRIH
jgi:ABC-type polysaccharide/polyol phosphate transport system ATPase subunit